MTVEWAVGVMAANRPMNTWRDTVWNLQKCGWRPIVFAEWDVEEERPYGDMALQFVRRPTCSDPQFPPENIGADGRMGCFQNFVQTLADLLWLKPTAEVIMVVEDDVIINLQAKEFVEKHLWPERRCGMMSMYCPDFRPYRNQNRGLFKVVRRHWICGQTLIFPREAVINALGSPSIDEWKGSYRQHFDPDTKPWERRASAGWISSVLEDMGMSAWCFSPSLAKHYAPVATQGMNGAYAMARSGRNIGPRSAFNFIGENANPNNIFPRVKEKMVIDKLRSWDAWHAGVRQDTQ